MRQQSFGSTIAQRLQGQQQHQQQQKNKKQQEGGIHYQKKVLLISFDDKSINVCIQDIPLNKITICPLSFAQKNSTCIACRCLKGSISIAPQ
jgi:hypothetical protein